tara:strand:+ start:8260 stop:8406 length:147 start_codon:yes stop_codon:yes gene_type:complete
MASGLVMRRAPIDSPWTFAANLFKDRKRRIGSARGLSADEVGHPMEMK